MYYEIFIDVLFTMNYVMDFFLLRLVNRLLHSSATLGRSLLGAFIGAGGICLLALRPGSRMMNTILVHVVINTLMVKFGCKLSKIRELLRGVLVLYTASFLLGGMIMLIRKYAGTWGIQVFLLSGTISYLFLAAGIRVYTRSEKKADRMYKVRLYANGKCKEETAFLDTGNRLTDSVSGKPVCICNIDILKGLLEENTLRELEQFSSGLISGNFGNLHPHFLPFISLGCSQGMVLAVTLDYLYLEGRNVHKIIRRPVIAVSGEHCPFSGDYQMILHPGLIDS